MDINAWDPSSADTALGDVLDRDVDVEELLTSGFAEEEIDDEDDERATRSVPASRSQTTAKRQRAADAAAPEATAEATPRRTRRLSGRYTSTVGRWRLTLRVDVDGHRPTKRVSGDFFRHSGTTESYFGSFIVDGLSVKASGTTVLITGVATTTWTTSYNHIALRITRRGQSQPPSTARLRWKTAEGTKGTRYVCEFESAYFRTVVLEQDYEAGVTPFEAYDTAALPSGGPARTLSVGRAYAEAGIEVLDSGAANEVPQAPQGVWSNSELHTAMENHFSAWANVPQWKVWLFHASAHEIGPNLYGIMFDQHGRQRQGCASFYNSVGGTSSRKQRDQLYVNVHELGHCFNLFHSFHKKYMEPPMPNRLDALSWMNYPDNYPGGSSSFWGAFPFQFDDLETIHLRHGFYDHLVFGGKRFGQGAALDISDDFTVSEPDHCPVRLELEAKDAFQYGEPVVVETKLRLRDLDGAPVHQQLHPNFGHVQLAIQRPGGEVVPFEPPLQHCAQVATTQLTEDHPAIYESAYIGFDKHRGQVFDAPGVYHIRGAYFAFDGSIVLSNVLAVHVLPPATPEDQEVARLLIGGEQGMLLYLLGSDGPALARGRAALESLVDEHRRHPLSVYGQLVNGSNLAREFKNLHADNTVSVREPQLEAAESLLDAATEASKGDQGLDNISLNQTMRRLAAVRRAAGNEAGARRTLEEMVDVFADKGLPAHVMSVIRRQAQA